MKKRFTESEIRLGKVLFLAGSGIVAVYFILKNISSVTGLAGSIVSILSPFIIGMVMAYLLCPIYNPLVRKFYRIFGKKLKSKKAALRWAKVLSSLIAVLLIIGVIAAVAMLIIPHVVTSVMGLIEVIPGRIDQVSAWIAELEGNAASDGISAVVGEALDKIYNYVSNFVESTLLPGLGSVMSSVSRGVITTVRVIFNFLIGIIVCVYFLNGKEHFRAQGRKMVISLFSREKAMSIFEFGNFCNRTFGGFISGKIIDSIIIGILCFILMNILGIPYSALISTIIGITNVIPFFGPFIGAVPSVATIFIVDPLKALYFVVLILLLQQFDGNILGPKILGDSTGLGSFWVMFAIIFFGGLFGFFGMLLGVPVFAVIYFYLKRYIDRKLRNKGLPEDTRTYEDFNAYDIDRKEVQ